MAFTGRTASRHPWCTPYLELSLVLQLAAYSFAARCPSLLAVWLIVEVDGCYHAKRASADARRDHVLRRLGCQVLHVQASLVLRQPGAAAAAVRAALAEIANTG